jgi:hypothetical protein
MPIQSREVVTLRLILDCDEADDLEDKHEAEEVETSPSRASLLGLPREIRLQILTYLLSMNLTRDLHTRRVHEDDLQFLLGLDTRRVLHAPQFKYKPDREINGLLPSYFSQHMSPAILQTCSQLYWEGRKVLYDSNHFVALQCGIPGLIARLRNYGLPMKGPLQPDRLLRNRSEIGHVPHEKSNISRSTPRQLGEPYYLDDRQVFSQEEAEGMKHAKAADRLDEVLCGIQPILTIRSQKCQPTTPFYVCFCPDLADLLHALWLMFKSNFARGIKFKIDVSGDPAIKEQALTRRLAQAGLGVWLHNHIENFNDAGLDQRLVAAFPRNRNSSARISRMLSYDTQCAFLEHQIEKGMCFLKRQDYIAAEMLFERACYEGCSMIRTRTSKLIDVSTQAKDGINRICKVVAISAYRLCELRSGAIASFRHLPRLKRTAACREALVVTNGTKVPDLERPCWCTRNTCGGMTQHQSTQETPVSKKTTRLDPVQATNHALYSGLLALRLPCATFVSEWNMRILNMLLDQFCSRDPSVAKSKWDDALWALNRLIQTIENASRELHLSEPATKVKMFKVVLEEAMTTRRTFKNMSDSDAVRMQYVKALVACVQDLVRNVYGEDLVVKKGFKGLIWTVRWA